MAKHGDWSRIPSYGALRSLGALFGIIGGIFLGISLLLLVVSVAKQDFVIFVYGLAVASAGVVYLAIGQGMGAFRDIARNSWKQVVFLRGIEINVEEQKNKPA